MASRDPDKERREALGPVNAKQTHLLWLQRQCSNGEGLFEPYPGEGKTWEEKQTFLQWKSQTEFQRVLHPIRMRQKTILLQPLVHSAPLPGYPVKEVERPILEHLQRFCQAFFLGMEVALAEPLDMATLKNLTSRVHALTNRTQYLVPDLLRHLKARRPRRAYCVVGITLFDLYPSPEWNFVMGHALLTEGCAVFSFGRHFNSEQNACEGESALLVQLRHLWALMRVMTHEICHVMGMMHCFYFRCAMNESASIDEAISQPLFLCPVCLRKLYKALKFNILDRYLLLKERCHELLQVSLEHPQQLPQVSPEHPQQLPQVSPEHPQQLPQVSPEHPQQLPQVSLEHTPHDGGRESDPASSPDPCTGTTPVQEQLASVLPIASSPGHTLSLPTVSSLDPTYSQPITSSPDHTHSPPTTLPFNRFQQSLDWLEKCLHSLKSSI